MDKQENNIQIISFRPGDEEEKLPNKNSSVRNSSEVNEMNN